MTAADEPVHPVVRHLEALDALLAAAIEDVHVREAAKLLAEGLRQAAYDEGYQDARSVQAPT